MSILFRRTSGIILLLLLPYYLHAQLANLTGTITDSDSNPIPGITILLDSTKGTATDTFGKFTINNISPGQHELAISGVGYQTYTLTVTLPADQTKNLRLQLREAINQMDEVIVQGPSTAELKRTEGLAVQVIETAPQRNLTADINQIIGRTPGINIREAGGLGSGFSLSLNGLSGNQVRYFIDGVPMENFGSALTLNNYPVNLIEEIEVYKGVVPISLGSDALGGAINIMTGYRRKSFLDASYSIGSFNTHRAAVNVQQVNPERGYFVKVLSFYNHSDNNYRMESVPLTDANGNIINNNFSTRRFHDHYTSAMLNLEAGLLDKSWADEWKVGITYAANRKNYQHPDFNIKRVFGEFHTRNQTWLASTTYRKRIGKLDLQAYVLAGQTQESIVDTSTFRYNWAGEAINRLEQDVNDPKGELNQRRSLFRLTDNTLRSQLNAQYFLRNSHRLLFNASQNYLSRTGEDKVDTFNRSFQSPNSIHKNLLGLAYEFDSPNERLNLSVFAKQYFYRGNIVTQDFENNDVTTDIALRNTGYGISFSYQLAAIGGVKTSFERAYRIPEPTEILGSGLYILPNPNLQPEQSYNLNLGGWLDQSFGKFELVSEWNVFARFSEDFIQPPRAEGPFGVYENLANVRTQGVEGSVQLQRGQLLMVNLNATYQHITDRTEFDEGLPNVNYRSRIPNIPYFFANSRVSLQPFQRTEDWHLAFHWTTNYVHEFFLKWENLGNPGDKNIIPTQLTFDLTAETSFREGRYNLSATVTNLSNETVFDNFLIQKPGRAFYLKLRYFLSNS
ncbi:TonB-dependent receptor [Tunicatimonas pelagia]|uniref:TonB-dependent receptor n=1 Tax=Tunicatimonas pelagia TaxID=931531 RepID=UPI00266717DA|nr:TonB-dependent receptor [Tunicatimonas pelagia]WKN43002.1 TonB-dependent receptor [Tunicatimonas pelagia]